MVRMRGGAKLTAEEHKTSWSFSRRWT